MTGTCYPRVYTRDMPYSEAWAPPIYRLCTTTHTNHLTSLTSLMESEEVILSAIWGTIREICRAVVSMYVDGVGAGLYEGREGKEELETLIKKWQHDLTGLMVWLDWSEW